METLQKPRGILALQELHFTGGSKNTVYKSYQLKTLNYLNAGKNV